MILRPGVGTISVIRGRLPYVAGATAYAALVVFFFRRGIDWIDTPISIAAMLGTALSILLGFRTASSYERWWEARKIWGAIVNDSRTFARQVLTLVFREDGERSPGPTIVSRRALAATPGSACHQVVGPLRV